ncbi:MAG: hypothetical protein ACLFVO_03705 [Chloroflexaceae bacterium]
MPAKPRGQHYAFAHRVLPALAWTHPDRLLELLTSSERDAFLQAVWASAGEQQPPADQVDGAVLHSSIHHHGPHTISLIILPPPIASIEAYFVALVFTDASAANIAATGSDSVRCFTLESGRNIFTEEEYTVLAEWRQDGHYNLGSGPPPESQAFLERLTALL